MLFNNIRKRCRYVFAIFTLLVMFMMATSASGQNIVLHVNGSVSSGTPSNPNPGESWGNAYKYLSAAIDRADFLINSSFATKVDIWVAANTYRPDESAANPTGSNSRSAIQFGTVTNFD